MKHFTVQISAGTGRGPVRQFVARLADHLVGVCGDVGLRVTAVTHHGDDDAPRSVEIDVVGDAPRLLADQLGTHVLVARSAQRGRRSRKRWFAGVSLHATPAAAPEAPTLHASDLEVTAARSGGPGGQHVNKTASAVRILHKPSGISVRAASERSQHRNRKVATERLLAVLGRRAAAESKNRTRALRLSHYRFERGSAVKEWRPAGRGSALQALAAVEPGG